MAGQIDWLAVVGWVGFFGVLVSAAIVIGRVTAGFFLRASGTRAGRH